MSKTEKTTVVKAKKKTNVGVKLTTPNKKGSAKDNTKKEKTSKSSTPTVNTSKLSKTTTSKTPSQTVKEVVDEFEILFQGKASKLSPKSSGHISYQLEKNLNGLLYVRLTHNTGGGNFSKQPVLLENIIDVLKKQEADRAFKSNILKEVFSGKGSKSVNNVSFLMAVLRSKDMALVVTNVKSQYLSNLDKAFAANAKNLLKK